LEIKHGKEEVVGLPGIWYSIKKIGTVEVNHGKKMGPLSDNFLLPRFARGRESSNPGQL
jgi:hypothetical protein